MAPYEEFQAALLEGYCAALRRDPLAPPPAELDAELAGVARRLAQGAAPEPGEATIAAIRRRVLAEGPAQATAFATDAMRHWPGRQALPTPAPSVPPRARAPLAARLAGAFAFAILALAFVGALVLILPGLRGGTHGGFGGGATIPPATGQAVAPAGAGTGLCAAIITTPTVGPAGAAYTATAGAKIAATVTAGPPSAVPTPPAGAISAAEARAAVRAFLGEPDAALSAEYDSGPLTRLRPQYLVRRLVAGGPTPPDSFSVDALSGEVYSARLNSNEAPCALSAPIEEAEALARAEAFARAHFPDFDRLVRRSFNTTTQEPSRTTAVLWQLRAADSGAWLPTAVTVRVSLATGRATLYSQSRQEYTGPTVPRLTMTQATEIALTELRQDPRAAGVTVESATLYAAPPNSIVNTDPTPRLLWQFQFGNVPPSQQSRTSIYVDATTGEIIRPETGG